MIWYEDFSSGCSFRGESEYVIDACPLLNSPKKEITIQLLKNPKQKTLYDTLAKASRQAGHATTTEQANAVHVKPKYRSKSPVAKSFPKSLLAQSLDSGLLLTSSTNGVIINDVHKPDNKSSSIATTGQGKGKGKMIVAQSLCSDDSSDDEAVPLFTRVSPPPVPLMGMIGGDIGPASPPKAPSAIQVLCASDLFDENKFLALASPEVPTLADFCYNEDDTGIFCIEDHDDNSLGENNSLPENSFHSIHSGRSIVRQIERFGVDASHPVELSSLSVSAKRRIEDMEDEDDASCALKRKRN